MFVDRYSPEEVFARVPELTAQTDPVLPHLGRLLDDTVRSLRSGCNGAAFPEC